MHVRKLKSRNGNLQIQVVQKVGRQNKVVKHLGTARNDLEINELIDLAKEFIQNQRIKSGKLSFFDNRYTTSEMAKVLSKFCIRRVLEAAVEGKCEYIVTGDKELLDLGSFKGIKIVTADRFLRLAPAFEVN